MVLSISWVDQYVVAGFSGVLRIGTVGRELKMGDTQVGLDSRFRYPRHSKIVCGKYEVVSGRELQFGFAYGILCRRSLLESG